VTGVRSKLPAACLTDSCQEEGCVLQVSELPSNRCLMRVDGCDELALPKDRKRCDFLLFVPSSSSKGHWVAPIELKGHVKRDDLDGIRDQLQTGAEVAEVGLASVGTGHDRVRVRPILGFSKLHPFVPRHLTKPEYRIEMRGRTELIRPVECGNSIRDKLR